MNSYLLLCLLTLMLPFQQTLLSQDKTPALTPVLVDKSALSGEGLKRIELKQEPERAFFQKNIYRGEELSVFIVSSQSWKGAMNNFSIDEYVYIFNGKSRAKPQNGQDLFFQSGEHFAIPKGYTGDWEVMAGENYHYELSVITTQRVPLTDRSQKQKPQAFDKNKLSGLEIMLNEQGLYEDLLFQGDELQIKVLAEKPRISSIAQPGNEKMISILSGGIKITDPNGKLHTFYTGDFLILPKGFVGTWESSGHGLVKYIAVEKS